MSDRSDHADLAALAARITALEDEKAIKELKYRYASYCDDHYDPEGITSLFVEDGHWLVTGAGGEATGHAEMRQFFTNLSRSVVWARHFMIAPRVEVAPDGQTATAEFYLVCFCTIDNGAGTDPERDAVVLSGTYVDRCVKLDGRWLFEEVYGVIEQASNWTEGWVRQPWR